MVTNFQKRIVFCITLFIALCTALFAEGESIPLDSNPGLSRLDQMQLQAHVQAAEDAHALGLLEVASRFYQKALMGDFAIAQSDLERLRLKYISTLIAQQKMNEAAILLGGFWEHKESAYYLRKAIVSIYLDDISKANSVISKVQVDQLSDEDRPWYFFVSGMMLKQEGQLKQAQKEWRKSIEQSITEEQSVYFDSLIIKEQILGGEVTEALIARMKKRLERYEGKKIPYSLVREYVIALDVAGDRPGAIDVLLQFIKKGKVKSPMEVHRLNLLLGILASKDTQEGTHALQQILESDAPRQMQAVALSLLLKAGSHSEGHLEDDFLETFIGAHSNHPLLDELYALRAQWYMSRGNLDAAQADAQSVIEQYSDSVMRPFSLRLLAYIAWSREPAQYRNAASYLTQLMQAQEHDLANQLRLKVLIADSYFLNKDYRLAAEVYEEVLDETETLYPKGAILFQNVLTYILRDKLELAQYQLDAYSAMPGVDAINIWRSEWALADAYRRSGLSDQALLRIQSLLDTPSDRVSIELRLRLNWLGAQLAMQAGQYDLSLELIEVVFSLVGKVEEGTLSQPQVDNIAAQSLLLKAKVFILSGKVDEGLGIWDQLRLIFPRSEAASLSYLEESRYYASLNRSSDAMDRCLELIEHVPSSMYAPIALYEAAIHAEIQGEVPSIERALILLERLVNDYPNSDLVFYARLKQADLLRLLNKFVDAQLVYQRLIRDHSSHIDKPLVELNYAKTLQALSFSNSEKGPIAIAAFERLFDLPGLDSDLRVEAGYHKAFMLKESRNQSEALDAYWSVISGFIESDDKRSSLSSVGQYWAARSIFDLAALFESARDYKEAQKVYELILTYELPGQALVETKLEKY